VGAWIACRRADVRFADAVGAVAPGLLVAQAVGRLGNYFNQELFGLPTDLPWGLVIDRPNAAIPTGLGADVLFHPTFLYESIWDLAVFFLLALVLRKRLRPAKGALFLAYIGLYSLGRFITEGLRTDPLMFGSIRVAQVVSLLSVAAALIAVPIMLRRTRA